MQEKVDIEKNKQAKGKATNRVNWLFLVLRFRVAKACRSVALTFKRRVMQTSITQQSSPSTLLCAPVFSAIKASTPLNDLQN